MSDFETLLVGLSLGPDDEATLDHVAALAPKLGFRSVTLAHTVSDDTDVSDAELRAEVEAAATSVADRTGLEARAVLSKGSVAPALLRMASKRGVDLLCVGRGVPRGKSASLGSSTGELVRQAPCSVLVVPRGAPVQLDNAAVPVDFSERSEAVLRLAVRIAGGAGNVLALHALGLPLGWHKRGVSMGEVIDERVARASGQWRQMQRRMGGDLRQVRLRIVVDDDPSLRRSGHVADLADAIEEADAGLVLLGSRGRSVGASILIGSVAARLSNRVFRPLLVVKEPDETMDVLTALEIV